MSVYLKQFKYEEGIQESKNYYCSETQTICGLILSPVDSAGDCCYWVPN